MCFQKHLYYFCFKHHHVWLLSGFFENALAFNFFGYKHFFNHGLLFDMIYQCLKNNESYHNLLCSAIFTFFLLIQLVISTLMLIFEFFMPYFKIFSLFYLYLMVFSDASNYYHYMKISIVLDINLEKYFYYFQAIC